MLSMDAEYKNLLAKTGFTLIPIFSARYSGKATCINYIKSKSFSFTCYVDNLDQLNNKLALDAYPSYILADKNKKIVKILKGVDEKGEINNLIIKLASGEQMETVTIQGNCTGDCENGYGEYKYTESQKYTGYWKNGKYHGHGVLINFEGTYNGNYENGIKNGQGTFNNRNGESYSGNWTNDKRNGYGIYKFSSGSVYKGNWVNDIPNGYGEYTSSKGSASGNFVDGVLVDDCKACNGTGKVMKDCACSNGYIQCTNCFGSGKVAVYGPLGTSYATCVYCKGHGRTLCQICKGAGKRQRECTSCEGRGKVNRVTITFEKVKEDYSE
jgi:hypothetical protein